MHDWAYPKKICNITVFDMDMKCLAQGQKKSMVGKYMLDFKDVDGKEFMKERQALMKANPSAWQEYKFMNPVTKKIEPKEMYLERFEDIVVSSGVYKKEAFIKYSKER